MQTKQKIIYIAGMGRSGSTLLDLVISTSNRVFSVGEIYNFNDIMHRDAHCACGKSVSDCPIWQKAQKEKNNIEISNHANVKDYFKILYRLYVKSPTSRKLFPNESNLKLISKIKKNAKLNDGDYILDSSKDVGRLIELAEDDRFEIYCIHIIRDPRGTASSYASKRGETSQNYYIALLKWLVANTLTRKYLKQKTEIKQLSIGFEEFCKDSDKHIAAIEKFLNIDIPENYVEKIREMDYHNIGGNRMSKRDNRRGFSGIQKVNKTRTPSKKSPDKISQIVNNLYFSKKLEHADQRAKTKNL